jgi:phage baseplate assembly protein V
LKRPFEEIIDRVVALESKLMQIVRIGYVFEVIEAEAKVRVECQDADALKSYKLPVLCHKTRCDKDYWMPDVGEHVLCVFLPLGQEIGFVLGSFYSQKDIVPVVSRDKLHVRFLDGTWIEYDRGSGDMQVHCRGKLTLAAGVEIELKTPIVKMPQPRIIGPGMPELKPVEPSPVPEPMEWHYG